MREASCLNAFVPVPWLPALIPLRGFSFLPAAPAEPSRQDVADHVSMDVREAVVPASEPEAESLVVKA